MEHGQQRASVSNILDLPVNPGNGGAGQPAVHAVTAQRDNDARVYEGNLARKIISAGRDFVWFRVAILGRAALDDVCNVHIGARDANAFQIVGEKATAAANKGQALLVFVKARPLTHKEHNRGEAAVARHGMGARVRELAKQADAHLGFQFLERRRALRHTQLQQRAPGWFRGDIHTYTPHSCTMYSCLRPHAPPVYRIRVQPFNRALLEGIGLGFG